MFVKLKEYGSLDYKRSLNKILCLFVFSYTCLETQLVSVTYRASVGGHEFQNTLVHTSFAIWEIFQIS